MCVQVKPFFFYCKWILWWHQPRDAAQRVVTWHVWDPRFNSQHYKEKAIISNCLDLWVQGERHGSGAWWQSMSSSVIMKHSQGNHRSAHSVSSRQLCWGPQVPESEGHPVSPFQRPCKNSPAQQNTLSIGLVSVACTLERLQCAPSKHLSCWCSSPCWTVILCTPSSHHTTCLHVTEGLLNS